jgi:S-adenosylmethionine uptake transporter
LRERISPRSISGSLLGLAGVAVILAGRLGGTHGDEAAAGMAAVLISAVFYAINLVMARHQAQHAQPVEIAFFQNLFVTTLYLVPAPWLATRPELAQLPAVVGAAALAVISLLLMSWAYARAEAQQLVAVEYTAFIWAAIMGWMVFGEPITAATLAGTGLIIAGCVIAARQRGAPALPEAEAVA